MRSVFDVFIRGWQSIRHSGKKVIIAYSLGLASLALLDAAGLFSLSRAGLASFNSSEKSQTNSALWILLVVALFIFRSLLSSIISYWGVMKFAEEEVFLGQKGYQGLSNMNWDERQLIGTVEVQNIVDRGPTALIQGVMIPVATIFSEILSATVIIISIFVLQPVTAFVVILYFGLTVYVQHKTLARKTNLAGLELLKHQNETYQLLEDSSQLSKLLRVMKSDSIDFTITSTRESLAKARAKTYFLSSLPRYFLEATLALGIVVIAGTTYSIGGESQALAATSLFAVAGFRLLPIVNRIQGLVLYVIGQVPYANKANNAINQIIENRSMGKIDNESSNLIVSLEEISYSYPNSDSFALKNINLQLEKNRTYAIVGLSGSGKTTLVDLILGVLTDFQGNVNRSTNLKQDDIAYVPQTTWLFDGDIYQNVSLEWSSNRIDKSQVLEALNDANISGVAEKFSEGEGGYKKNIGLSGGQEQRIGLARALYRKPKLLVLDEATSALDSVTEQKVMRSISRLHGEITLIIVAHRLSTVKDADKVIFMSEGEIKGIGSFDELRERFPEFDQQVRLAFIETSD